VSFRAACVVAVALALAVPGAADVLCPRVTSEHVADTTDLGRFGRHRAWNGKSDAERAVAMWRYLCDEKTGLFHMNTVNDGRDPWGEYSTVRDPVKLLNVYNVGYCGIFGPVLDGVYQGAGFEIGRSFGVSGWSHCTTEVWYDGGWHYLDLDVRGALMKPDGTIASLDEARTRRDLWVDPVRKVDPFFPKDHDKARVFEIYRDSRIDYNYRWFQMGHVMDFRLRPGESLTRWWHPQGGRWHHLDVYNKNFVRALLEKEPRGYKSNHPTFSVWTQGNGLWRWAPSLSDSSRDLLDGARRVENVRPGDEGLRLATSGRGEIVLEVFTPWIIVPRINDVDDTSDDTEASVVKLDAALPVAASVSLDHGRTWTPVATVKSGKRSVDLTRWVRGTYGFLVKLEAIGRANDLALRALTVDTWVQVAPISLPRLERGLNRCRYDIGDRYGRPTQPMFVLPNVAEPSDLARYVVEMPADYDLTRKTARIRGDVTLALEAPAGTLIDWFTAGACFTTHQNDGARNTANRIAYAVGEPDGFREIYKANVPTWVNHWRYQWDQDVRLEKPAKIVFVRYTGKPAVNVLRATLHLKPERKPRQAIRITHAWKVGDRLEQKTVEMQRPGGYTVEVRGEPTNVFVRMEVPSSAD